MKSVDETLKEMTTHHIARAIVARVRYAAMRANDVEGSRVERRALQEYDDACAAFASWSIAFMNDTFEQ